MNVRQFIELLEDYGDHLEIYVDYGDPQGAMKLDLAANNFELNEDGNLVINL